MNKTMQKMNLAAASLLVALWAGSASADIYLVFEYDQQADTTTATYSGSWNTFQIDFTIIP